MTPPFQTARPVEILLVEDNPADVRLTREALKEAKVMNTLHVVGDGVEAMDFLHNAGKYARMPTPDLILKTTDGGHTWNVKHTAPGVYLRCIGFAGASTGWVGTLTQNRRLLHISEVYAKATPIPKRCAH